jgi:hypothetical protein
VAGARDGAGPGVVVDAVAGVLAVADGRPLGVDVPIVAVA